MYEPPFSDEKCAELCRFARAVWGSPNAVLRRSGDINFIDLRPYSSAFQRLFAGALSHDRILVRQEYLTALQALATETYYRGAYVTGQPGIGKTLFLIYVLVVRLGRKHAVALQFPDGRPLYALFHASGVSFHSLHDSRTLDKFPNLWALTDSNAHVEGPSGIFLGTPDEIRVIQTTSPKEARWKEWSKQTQASGYVMDIWSAKEIHDLSILLGLDSKRMRRMSTLAERWGGVPRSLLEFLGTADLEIEARYRARAIKAIRNCAEMIPAIAQNAAQFDESPSQIFFCRPWIAEYRINRKLSRATVPTRTIRRLLGEALQARTNYEKLVFFNAFRQSSETSQAAGIIFENWFHSFIFAGRTIQCHWVQGTGEISVEGQSTLVPTNWSAVKLWDPPYLWVAPRNFEGIDSVLVLEEKIYAFQVTISSRHKSPTEGMKKFQENLPTALKKLPWSVVFVGDSEHLISNVANKWIGKISMQGGTEVPIAWCAVDPADPNVVYQEFREEDDDATEMVSSDAMEVELDEEGVLAIFYGYSSLCMRP